MRRGLIALLTAVFLVGVGTARAAITTNLVQDFSTFDRTELLWNAGDPQNGDEILGGLGDNRWMTALNAAVYTNQWGKLLIKSSNDKSRVALYTITADQFSGADPNAQLHFTLQNLQNQGILEVAVFHIINPGTTGQAVEYDVLGGPNSPFVTDGSGVGLMAVGAADVALLVSTNIGGLANNDPIEGAQTISFPYNGNDDIVIGFSVIGTSGAHKTATIDDVVVTSDDDATLPVTDDNIIAVFNEKFSTPDSSFPSVAASISGGLGENNNYGSTDTSYGSLLGDAPTVKGAYSASSNANVVIVSVTNTTPDTEVLFDSFNFDIGRRWAKAPNSVNVAITGDIDNNASITNHTGFTEFTGNTPYLSYFDDFDIDLTGLADRSLEYGEVATFTMTFDDPIDTSNPDSVVAIDNIVLLGSVETPTELQTDPSDELALSVVDALGVTTGTVAVSYIEDTFIPTNVAVLSVSVVNPSHGGFSVTPTLFTLDNPAPSNQTVSVVFDNGTANLTVGQTATGIVQIVWNEVGLPASSSSTSSLPVSATYLEVRDDNTIAIFEHKGVNASPRLQGLTAKITGGHGSGTSGTYGSTDGTYGTRLGDARTDGGCYQASFVSPVISVAITNNTGSPAIFDSLHFDAAKNWAKAPSNVTVSISGSISSTNVGYTGLTQFNGIAGDYDDFDIVLTGLADRTLEHGESALIEFTFSDGYVDNSNAVSMLDNIALLGSGSNGATLTKVPNLDVGMGVTRSDTTVSELIEMFYTEGDAATNIVFNSVSFTNETHAGAFSYSGLISGLSTPEETNGIVTVEFNNASAQLVAGEVAEATMLISWNEAGFGERTYDLDVYAARPADVPEGGVVALFNYDFLTPDAAMDGILGTFDGGAGFGDDPAGSDDGTYGSLVSPAAPSDASCWVGNSTNNVVTLTVTNQNAGDIVLSSFNFDIGRRWEQSPEAFTLGISGDVTDDPALVVASGLTQVGNIGDFDDFDVALTNLVDHTLGTGESVVFTFTFVIKPGLEWYGTSIDNLALTTDLDAFGIWAISSGLTPGVNHLRGDNPDGDGMDNLMEYATNGDPMSPDTAATLWQEEETGTNWFYHVYSERTDDPNLAFTLDARGNLMFGPDWSTNGLYEVGESTPAGGFKSVTNRTDITEEDPAEFIRLQVQEN